MGTWWGRGDVPILVRLGPGGSGGRPGGRGVSPRSRVNGPPRLPFADDETAVRAVSAAAPPPPPAVAGGRVCQFCARIHPFVRAQCPAWGKVCRVYGGQNHFAAGTTCPCKITSQ